MTRPVRLIPLLLVALVAGCGDSAAPSPAPDQQQQQSRVKPASGGTLNVGVTGGGIGTATQAGPGGARTLPNGRVDQPSNTQQGVGAGATCDDTDVAPAQDNLPVVITATLCLLNGERADAGLPPLKQNAKLDAAARLHSQDMVDNQYFDHAGKDGSDPVDRIRATGYIPSVGSWTVGENLAWGTGVLATPKEIVSAWMHSQGHRENILRPQFKEIGFGVVIGNPRSDDGAGATYTNTFGGITGASRPKAPRTRRARTARAHTAAKKRKPLRARIAKG